MMVGSNQVSQAPEPSYMFMNGYGPTLMAMLLVVWFEVHVDPQEDQTDADSLIISLSGLVLYKPGPRRDQYNT
ncbi:hypothetical protein CROQUDRAFT_663764 [Cronartium quercuum f. sp. fusiforme G11]|uniref:Uncharacterized protein n=1 Tax=Cronartium quercuum f. sp. fusiforme G11 TaxID=708437 RepID=A0A9P6NCH0_9BASI|nr:hypothetical protein CROQUDRAFT_663764 [Cronartium quercuum f. sp. fusiforme G11]